MRTDEEKRIHTLPAAAQGVAAVMTAADRLRRTLSGLAASSDLSFPQYNVLRILRGAGGGLPTMEIRRRMLERAPGITRIVDRLESKGLVKRSPSPEDRRQVVCELTAAGAAILTVLDERMDAADLAAFRGLTPRQLQQLCRLLQQVALD